MKNEMKVASLLIGKANSSGFPGKNVMPINGMPSCEYACIISRDCGVNRSYVSTDCDEIAKISGKYGFKHIVRPSELATSEALTEDALLHAYKEILKDGEVDIIILLFANNPAISLSLVKKGLEILKEDESYDSAFSVCKYNMFSPTRARKIVDETIMPFVPLDIFPEVSSIRSSQGDVYFCDLSVQVIRARVFEDMWNGNLPFRWQGKKSYPLKNSYGFDIDEGWQKVAIEKWLKENWHEK